MELELGDREEEEAEAIAGGTASGYSEVPCEELGTAQSWKRRLPRPPRAAVLLPALASVAAGTLLALNVLSGRSAAPASSGEAALNATVALYPGGFSCARFGCLDVRSKNPCGCSHWCVQDGNCCPDYHAACSVPATRARLGVWAGCHPPGPPPPPPGGWSYVPHGPELQVKVLSFNPEWWHVIEQLGGNGNSIAKVIMQASQPMPFDFIGFQEFYDPWYGLARPGFDASSLLNNYMFVRGEVGGPVGTIIGFRKASWVLLARGQRFVGEDRKGPNYFGKRIALWARFKHTQTGKTVFFMNHHGPLPLNTGGVCGGMMTANNLLHVIVDNAQQGDAVIFVGDFNANAASLTVKQLSSRLHRCFAGIDHIFTNLPPASVLHQVALPSGGSDHPAISALLQLPGTGVAPAAPAAAAGAVVVSPARLL